MHKLIFCDGFHCKHTCRAFRARHRSAGNRLGPTRRGAWCGFSSREVFEYVSLFEYSCLILSIAHIYFTQFLVIFAHAKVQFWKRQFCDHHWRGKSTRGAIMHTRCIVPESPIRIDCTQPKPLSLAYIICIHTPGIHKCILVCIHAH